jgi:hypothetical protein
MFEHLPVVSEATNKAFWDEMDELEAGEIANDMNERMVVLEVNNRYLSTAILSCAEIVAVNFKGHTKEAVKADTVVALLVVLSLIDKALEK